MELDRRTLNALDWDTVREALAAEAVTARGIVACREVEPLPDLAAIARALDGIDEVRAVRQAERDVPLGDVSDIEAAARKAAKGEVLDLAELRRVGGTLLALQRLASAVLGWEMELPVLQAECGRIGLDGGLVATLAEAFDEQGRLSAAQWPELGELRARIAEIHIAVRRTLDEMLKSEDMAELLQDAYVTQRRDRYVLPLKAKAKGLDLGIVHDTSGTGQTVFIEPTQVVALNNQLKIAEGELEAAETRIRAQLSRWVGVEAQPIADALDASTVVDGLVARAGLADRLGATRPRVGTDGVVRMTAARHPVLLLRGIDVIPNDLGLDTDRPALVLSGPNAGGKTVALKTIGLCALLVRVGCFVPAAEGSRVDRFPVVCADIGDAQSIQGDLSSFSGHLVVLREMLRVAGPGTMLLLDEIATGTDPSQGAALARAVLEAFLDRGARVVVTTHYAQLKGMATTDPRFAVAAMEYAGDHPTYHVVAGATGESHALSVAGRLGLDPAVLARAHALLGDGERAFAEALEGLATQRVEAYQAAAKAREEAARLEGQRKVLEQREQKLRERADELEKRAAEGFVERIKRAEKAISEVVAQLQRSPGHDGVRKARATIDALRGLVEPSAEPEPVAVHAFAPGDRVRLVRMGTDAVVVSVGDGALQVRTTGGLAVRARLEDVLPAKAPTKARDAAPRVTIEPAAPAVTDLDDAVRYEGNTCDLRGLRVEEALLTAEQFLDDAVRHRLGTVFFLHGHGTGAIKQALREWLPTASYVRDFQPANADQGGDAFTTARLR